LPAPARRAFENKGIKTVTDLSHYSKKEILKLHGVDLGSIPKLLEELQKEGLNFKES
jgi:predicted RecB family nuclease